MKKRVVELGVLTLFVLLFSSLGVFAAVPAPGTCIINTQAECVAAAGNHIVMGLSATTNAHAEFPYNGYPYVLCCGFGSPIGNTTCNGVPPINKVLGLSSTTNAHAEIPSGTNYLNPVCYEDLQCVSTTSNCGTGTIADYRLNFTSLSSTTNAHVGPIDAFSTKICCKSAKYLSYCSIVSVGTSWRDDDVYEGVRAYIDIKGSGPECDGQTVNIEVIGATVNNATSVSFTDDTALSWWTAEWQRAGFLGGDKSYSFNATVVGVLNYAGKSMVSDNEITVRQMSSIDYCADMSSCEDYTDATECSTDSPCDFADAEGRSQGYVCDGIGEYCSCSWNDGVCDFRVTKIEPGECESGYTLCHDTSANVDYCYPAATCPTGDAPITDSDGICEAEEGCSSSDCASGGQDSCVAGTSCSGGMCSGGTTPTSVNCSYGYTLCQIGGIKYCYPGSSCPSADQIPPSNSNGKCDPGTEGCTSTDCKDGDRDSCVAGTYCMSGKCAAIEDPITVLGETEIGGCKMTQTIQKGCDTEPTGYKIIKWVGTWTGAGGNPSNPEYQKCRAGGTATVVCPAQIQLSFFSYYSLIGAIVIIVLIYIFIVFRKRFKKAKRKKK